MPDQERDQSIRLSDVVRRILRRWKLILVGVACFALAGATYSFVQEETFTASATLTVSPITTNPFNAAAVNQQINITTEREILSSREVARIASEKLSRDVSPAELLAGSEVAAPSGSQVLEVTVTADTPDDAADFANALAEAYLEFRAEGASEVALGFIEELDRRITSLEESEALSPEDRSELSSLRDQRASLSLVAENPGRIIGEAAPPGSPSSPGLTTWIAIGAALGLLIGVGVAFLRDRLDPLVRDPSRMRERAGRSDVVVFHDAHDDEAARSVLMAVLDRRRSAERAGGPFTVMVASTDAEEIASATDSLITTARQSSVSAHLTHLDGLHLTHSAGNAGEAVDLLFLDATAVIGSAAIASAAAVAGCVIVIASRRSPMADVERLLRDTSTSPSAPICVFLQHSEAADARGPRAQQSARGHRAVDRRAGVS